MARPRKTPGEQAQSGYQTAPAVTDIAVFLQHRNEQAQLRVLICGASGDGKSTLLGRLLWEMQQWRQDELALLSNTVQDHALPASALKEQPNFALALDGLEAERQQGSTIEVGYRYFASWRRRFMVADTPGRTSATHTMLGAASNAELAIVVVDAARGIMPQTRRHTYLLSLVGVRHIVLTVNKMDLLGFSADGFAHTVAAFQQFTATLGFASITAIPVSARQGDNLTRHSGHTPWYAGATLIGMLDTIKLAPTTPLPFAFPVQWVNHPEANFYGLSGTIAEGQVSVGDAVRVSASGRSAQVIGIITMDGPLRVANAGQAVTLRLDSDNGAERGDLLCASQCPLEMSDQFEASVVWLDQDPGLIGRNYAIQLAGQESNASITNIKYRIDTDLLTQQPCKSLTLHDICVCNIATNKPMAFMPYQQSSALGSFILVDRISHATVGMGMIRHNLRRAQNVHRQALTVTRREREALNGHRGKVIWFTGLSGSGKSTIANALEVSLHQQGRRTYILDGDNVRQGLNKDLGFTDADRVENIRRIAEVAKLMLDAGMIVMASFISPFRREREMARELIGPENFIEVYVNSSLAVCEQRDPKGLYKKARAGTLPNMSGIGSPYEPPEEPQLIIDSATLPLASCVQQVCDFLSLQNKVTPD
ncbi:MAG: adenylyl-sulfate kinase [Pseudomonadota bacterium]